LGTVATPGPQFSVGGLVAVLGRTKAIPGLLVTQPLAHGGQTHAAVHQFSGMTVSQLAEGAGISCTLRVGPPVNLDALVAEQAAAFVLSGLVQRAMRVVQTVDGLPEFDDQCTSAGSAISTVRLLPPMPGIVRCSSPRVRSKSSR
jgi:hypothetical protein